ncbi:hypothetical protein KCU65_g7735, partial [Aureobasidium melanogenum]
MAPASFSSLPPELVSKICSDPGLEKKDLIALRFTSKAQGIYVSATKAFGKRYFAEISLLYTKYSLETFVKICGHPIFGPGIRRVELSCSRFKRGSFNKYVKTLADCGYPRERLVHEVQRLSARCDAEKSLKVHDAKALLQRAFAYLAKSNHSLTIRVLTGEDNAIGGSQIFPADDESKYFYTDVPFALNLLLGAARQSGCKAPKLDILVASRRFSHKSNCELSYFMHMISEISFELVLIEDYGDDEPRGFILWIRDLLSYGINIKALDLFEYILDDGDDRKIEPILQVVSRLPLEDLRLRDLNLNQKTMTDLVKSLGSTLRRLTIGCCDMVGSWKEVLICIQQNAPQLDYFQMYDSRITWLRSCRGPYEGTTAVQSGLEKMLQAEQDAAAAAAQEDPDDESDDE